eukprot:gnl/TRDRNA2_/TRDRNA2_158059_c0_seq1.p1 gnl/TRDRNA2_/TRDRNA2_158059_c0~~gnl/TRDRNA2_/TRDRNA2_158059_c0_seq1.p1  ORF type:complete len:116 (+),score=29.73 gnl/TRDRNA2_/TRDRNA2_158059_c0_seq1:34-348(+)
MATSEQEGMPPAPESPRSMSSVPIDSSNRHPMLWFALVLAVAAALTVLVGFAVLQVKAVGNFRSWQRKPDAGNKLDSFSEESDEEELDSRYGGIELRKHPGKQF